MRIRKSKRLFTVVVEFVNGVTRTVQVRATCRETAEKRALKFNRGAIGVKRHHV